MGSSSQDPSKFAPQGGVWIMKAGAGGEQILVGSGSQDLSKFAPQRGVWIAEARAGGGANFAGL